MRMPMPNQPMSPTPLSAGGVSAGLAASADGAAAGGGSGAGGGAGGAGGAASAGAEGGVPWAWTTVPCAQALPVPTMPPSSSADADLQTRDDMNPPLGGMKK